MQENLYRSRALLYRRILCRVLEPASFHSFQKDRRFVATGIGDNRLAAWREEPRYEVSEGGGVLALVENIRSDNQVEGPQTPYVRFAPVEAGDLRFQIKVRAGIEGCEIEGGPVVVCREHSCAAGECRNGGKPDTAPQLDGVPAPQIAPGEVTSQGEGARPEFGPVREPLVAVEVVFVDQVVRRDGMRDAVSRAPGLDRGFG